MNELALFAGAGGGILGGKLLGWKTVCAVEWDGYARDVLLARQNDGSLEVFPIWDDVQSFDGYAWRGRVDVVSGGFPCQDISAAGKGAGINGERSGMWGHMARIIGEVRPRFVFVENSPMLTSRGLGRVLGDLASMGYDARWGVLGAVHAGAPHRRDRIWIVGNLADSSQLLCDGFKNQSGVGMVRQSIPEFGNGSRAQDVADAGHLRGRNWPESSKAQSATAAGCSKIVGDSKRSGLEGANSLACACKSARQCGEIAPTPETDVSGVPRTAWWKAEPEVGRVADGVAARVDRLRCLGNGQVPAVAALAWNILN
jgi:DNA (cytosine-5)-methyltransferase 1